jgi:hypothetical protein
MILTLDCTWDTLFEKLELSYTLSFWNLIRLLSWSLWPTNLEFLLILSIRSYQSWLVRGDCLAKLIRLSELLKQTLLTKEIVFTKMLSRKEIICWIRSKNYLVLLICDKSWKFITMSTYAYNKHKDHAENFLYIIIYSFHLALFFILSHPSVSSSFINSMFDRSHFC